MRLCMAAEGPLRAAGLICRRHAGAFCYRRIYQRGRQQHERWGRRGLHSVGGANVADGKSGTTAEPLISRLGADDVLATACVRARQISARASKSSAASLALSPSTPATSPPSDKTCREAIGAAEALLTLTLSTVFARALREKVKNSPSESDVSCLHGAFLSVASWLCELGLRSLAPANDNAEGGAAEELVAKSLDLARRSAELSLPLHAPLYSDLALLAAARSPSSAGILSDDRCHARVLELAALSRESLHKDSPAEVSFFSRPLLALARRGLFREAILLIEGMQDDHMIDEMDRSTGLQIIGILADRLMKSGGNNDFPNIAGVREALTSNALHRDLKDLVPLQIDTKNPTESLDLMEFFTILQGPLLRQLEADTLKNNEDIENLDSVISDMLGLSPSDDESDDEDNGKVTRNTALSELIEQANEAGTLGESTHGRNKAIGNSSALTVAVNIAMDSKTGDIKAINFFPVDDEQEQQLEKGWYKGLSQPVHDKLAADMVYVRDTTWDLPDIVHDLSKNNSGKDVMYTRQFEEYLMEQIAKDEERYDGDDDLSGDDSSEDDFGQGDY